MAKNKEIFRTKSTRLLNQLGTGSTGIVSITINGGADGSVLRMLECFALATSLKLEININGNPSYGTQTFSELIKTDAVIGETFDLITYLPNLTNEAGIRYVPIETGESITVTVDFSQSNNGNSVIAGIIEDY